MHRYGSMAADNCRRKLVGLSRPAETPRTLIYEWTPGTAEFRTVPDVVAARFWENWEVVRAILAERKKAATHKELLSDWPPDRTAPSAGQLYEWLSRATREQLAVRLGAGTKDDPYRFRLPREDNSTILEPLPKLEPLR